MRRTGEILAKVCICLLTGVTLFAFGYLLYDAQRYQAAESDPPAPEMTEAADASDAPREDAPATPTSLRVSPAPRQTTARPPAPQPESTVLRPSALAALRRRQAEADEALEGADEEAQTEETAEAPEAAPAEENPIDAEALVAELERMAALGFELAAGEAAGRTYEKYMGIFHATAYCAEAYPHICGGNGVTASGTVPTPGLTAAADWGLLPPGTWLYIDGVGIRRVEDSGSAIKKYRLDVNVDTHQNALAWPGFGRHEVWVLAWPPDYEPPADPVLTNQGKLPPEE